jgi:hypothetical protein
MKYPITKYSYYAVAHPFHIVLLAGATVFGIRFWSWAIFFSSFVAYEVLLLAIILSIPGFRRHVENMEDGKRAELEHKVRVAEDTRYRIMTEESDTAKTEWMQKYEQHIAATQGDRVKEAWEYEAQHYDAFRGTRR